MNSDASQAWRKQGNAAAFNHEAWEFQSRQFLGSARLLLQIRDAATADHNFETSTALSTSTFLLSLAIEQISKAYYLKSKLGPRESIYTHSVSELCGGVLLNARDQQLMSYAEAFVIWAGRYPTPKWTKEQFKEAYDVPYKIIDGVEHIDAEKLPNSASRERTDELLALYELIHKAWQAAA